MANPKRTLIMGPRICAKQIAAHKFRAVVYPFVKRRFQARRLRLATRTERTQDEAETGGTLEIAG